MDGEKWLKFTYVQSREYPAGKSYIYLFHGILLQNCSSRWNNYNNKKKACNAAPALAPRTRWHEHTHDAIYSSSSDDNEMNAAPQGCNKTGERPKKRQELG